MHASQKHVSESLVVVCGLLLLGTTGCGGYCDNVVLSNEDLPS